MAVKRMIVCDNCGAPTSNYDCIDHSAYCDKPECQKAKAAGEKFRQAVYKAETKPGDRTIVC